MIAWIFETVFYVCHCCLNRLMSPLSKDETRRDSSLALIREPDDV